MHSLLLDVSSLAYGAYSALKDSVRNPTIGRWERAWYLGMVTRLMARAGRTRWCTSTTTTGARWPGPAVRGYKADRPPEPEDLTPQFSCSRGMLEATGATQAHSPDWEAEDAIGALCARGEDGIGSRS